MKGKVNSVSEKELAVLPRLEARLFTISLLGGILPRNGGKTPGQREEIGFKAQVHVSLDELPQGRTLKLSKTPFPYL